MRIHLIGVNHDVQRFKYRHTPSGEEPSLSNDQLNYKDAVDSAIRDLKPDLLAEEDNPKFFCRDEFSILKAFECHYGIEHRFVDPDLTQRLNKGYKDKCSIKNCWRTVNTDPYTVIKGKAHEIWHQFPIRERLWLDELRATPNRNVLLICGDMHIETLPRLKAKGIKFKINNRGIGADTYTEKETDQCALEWAKRNLLYDDGNCFCRRCSVNLMLD
jgi:hypothetical protein